MTDVVYDGTTPPSRNIDSNIVAGGVAQVLYGTCAHGWAVYNPSASDWLWVSSSTTAAPNAKGSIGIPPGGGYETPPGYHPVGPISIYGAVTGQPITARGW
jgi:hypothetical protein